MGALQGPPMGWNSMGPAYHYWVEKNSTSSSKITQQKGNEKGEMMMGKMGLMILGKL